MHGQTGGAEVVVGNSEGVVSSSFGGIIGIPGGDSISIGPGGPFEGQVGQSGGSLHSLFNKIIYESVHEFFKYPA